MAVDVPPLPDIDARNIPVRPQVLRVAAADIERGDQVAFVAPDGEHQPHVAGGVTGVRCSRDGATVAVVVANRVHFVPADHRVVIIRGVGGGHPRRTVGPAR